MLWIACQLLLRHKLRLFLLVLFFGLAAVAATNEDREKEVREAAHRSASEAFVEVLADGASRLVPLAKRINDVNFSPAPNILFIMADQLRYDALGFIQARMSEYEGKLQVRTPNIDRIATSGVSFEVAYCVSPSCGPARSSLKTGNSLQRTGILHNKLFSDSFYTRMPIFESRVLALDTLEQTLVAHQGYTAELYGKFHAPLPWFWTDASKSQKAITYNEYDYRNDSPLFNPEVQIQPVYRRTLDYLLERDGVNTTIRNGQQINDNSKYPYDPIRIDSRYGMPTNTPLSTSAGFDKDETDDSDICGRDSLGENYTDTAVVGDMAVRALDRLIRNYQATKVPFILGASFRAPHPPVVATSKYFDYYHDRYSDIALPRNIKDRMVDSAYVDANQRKNLDDLGTNYTYNNPDLIAEYTSVYYAMIEEIDTWVGQLLDKLESSGLHDDTMIVFTSDHGEMLGAHGMLNKGILLEEATRVPLILSYPNAMPRGAVVNASTPVSHMDVFATILDYTQTSHLDHSDGQSLRRFIEHTSYNERYDERTVVVEVDFRFPVNQKKLSGHIGDEPNFMIRKGNHKLILPKSRSSSVVDMLYDLTDDPETDNLLGGRRGSVRDSVIGKAEHLKILLIEALRRVDGPKKFYSDNKWNLGEGGGDIVEIKKRQTWRSLDYWQSDLKLSFGAPVYQEAGFYIRKEYFYVGRTTSGAMYVYNVDVTGDGAQYFKVDYRGGNTKISQGESLRVGVTFNSTVPVAISSLSVVIEVSNSVRTSRIQIVGEV